VQRKESSGYWQIQSFDPLKNLVFNLVVVTESVTRNGSVNRKFAVFVVEGCSKKANPYVKATDYK
jgi:hypothetical protein